MTGLRRNLGFGGIALLPIACCIGLPLLVAAGFGVAAVALVGGITAGALALAAAIGLLIVRARRRRRLHAHPITEIAEEVIVEPHDCCTPVHAHEDTRAGERTGVNGGGPLVEVLYFDGCPNHEPAIALVERIGRELGIEPQIQLVNVPDQEAAQRLRFLGSPTVRVDGRDVDPHTEKRSDYGFSCRVFRTEAGVVGQPDERWVRDALIRAPAANRTGRTP